MGRERRGNPGGTHREPQNDLQQQRFEAREIPAGDGPAPDQVDLGARMAEVCVNTWAVIARLASTTGVFSARSPTTGATATGA